MYNYKYIKYYFCKMQKQVTTNQYWYFWFIGFFIKRDQFVFARNVI